MILVVEMEVEMGHEVNEGRYNEYKASHVREEREEKGS